MSAWKIVKLLWFQWILTKISKFKETDKRDSKAPMKKVNDPGKCESVTIESSNPLHPNWYVYYPHFSLNISCGIIKENLSNN